MLLSCTSGLHRRQSRTPSQQRPATETIRTPGFTHVGPTHDCDGSALAHTHGDLELHSVDLCGGTIAQTGPTGAGNAYGIARGPGGLLWGKDIHSGQLVQLHPSMDISEGIASVEHELGSCDMAQDPTRRVCLASTGTALYAVAPSTGATERIGTIEGQSNLSSLSFIPECE